MSEGGAQECGVIGRIGGGVANDAIRSGQHVSCRLACGTYPVMASITTGRYRHMGKCGAKEGRVVVGVSRRVTTAVAAVLPRRGSYVERRPAGCTDSVMARSTSGRPQERRSMSNCCPQPGRI